MSHKLNSARAFLTAGNFAAARKAISDVLRDEPENASAWELRIDIEIAAGKHGEALKLIRARLAKTPERVKLRTDEILCLSAMERDADTHKALDAFRRDFPFLETNWRVLACIFEAKRGDLVKANALFQELNESVVNRRLLLQIELMIRTRLGDRFGRAAVCLDWVRDDPQDASAQEWLSFAQFELLEFGASKRAAQVALRLDPSARLPHAMLWLTQLVWVPPFLVSEVIGYLSAFATSYLGRRWEDPIRIIISFVAVMLMFRVFSAVFPNPFVSVALVAGLVGWPFLKAGILRLYGTHGPAPKVVLSEEY